MRLKVTRLAKYEDLLLEADIIRVGNDLAQVSGDGGESTSQKQDKYDKIDKWIDDLIDSDLERYLSNENFINAFTADQVIATMNEYLAYCKTRIVIAKEKLASALKSVVQNPDYIKSLNLDIAKISDRIETLLQIYSRAKSEKSANVVTQLSTIKEEIFSYYYSPILVKSEEVKNKLTVVKKSTDEVAKINAAASVIEDVQILEEITEEYPEEVKVGVADASSKIEEEISKEIGQEKLEDLKAGRKANIHFTKIVQDILEYEQLYSTEAEIKETARLLKTVRIGQNENLDEDSKAYLTAWVTQIEESLLKKAQDKSIQLDMNKGIHFDFNIKLPLFQTVMLPVTGKQIADASFIGRARKKSSDLLNTIFTPTNQTAAYRAAEDIGRSFSTIYSIGLNKLAKTIGKAVKGREGEMKADAISRMLMPTTEYLDKYIAKTKATEEAASPGVSMQVPGSIGSMGPITPPTQTSLGSGDNFGPKKKKKRIMEFAEFWKNKNQQ
jgi:hypothetical protein